ncbi:MAG: PAS domain-containing protein [Hyphomonadaceae bacterium]
MPDRVAVSAADFIRSIGHWQNEALRRPVSITHHGRERLVLATPDVFSAAQAPGENTGAAVTALRADVAAVLENLDEGYIGFDTGLSVRIINAVAAAFVGRAADECRGASVIDLMPQPLASILTDRLQRVGRTRKAESFEASTFDGRHVSVRVFPTSHGAGVLLRNTTEQHALARRFEEGVALDLAVRTHAAAVAIRLDVRSRIEAIDDGFCARSGFSRADLVGHRFVDLVAAPQRRAAGELIERVLREGEPRQIVLMLLGKRGEELAGTLALAPVLTDFIAHGIMALWVSRDGDASAQAA